MYRLIVILILLGIVYWMVKKAFFPTRGRTANTDAAGEEMVQDPVCGCYLPQSQSIAISDRGKRVFFCSQECLQKYRSSQALPRD